ncbi:MAG: triose-phosphate isomerase [Candidatus Yanofskybacteria bacterium CG10_big_fil_rev_8_21_14_0_10_46_23]|uniref:Triosephosphate isomerase n=1 Tax=Candidatus Yanofskybacteria bacterium CG10_big_fil_rev_8_21_14_0_10_46_23 TaxID=1975098 RepID=A0A2H0R3V0_9BACT|nr:MAG: triose-phosphate isomerase [Candidatus Yanofskybacteria bacterium CG10_big_fil_rev_8_21_14_0_10_46_23]
MKKIIANWKMNPASFQEAQDLIEGYPASTEVVEIIVAPPAIFLKDLMAVRSDLNFCAQNCHWEDSGPYTGEVSAKMLAHLGVRYCLVGHSDRRWKMGETEMMINQKIKALLRHNLTPILAIGCREREENRREVLEQQLSNALAGLSPEDLGQIIIAHEPVWAISATENSQANTPEMEAEALTEISQIMQSLGGKMENQAKIVYGGSIDSRNVAEFLKLENLAGVFVGGASLKAEEFGKIVSIAN